MSSLFPEKDASKNIPGSGGTVSPLQALRSAVKQTVDAGRAEEAAKPQAPATPTPATPPAVQIFHIENNAPEKKEPQRAAPKTAPKEPTPAPTPTPAASAQKKKTSSLLAKCMPFISDGQSEGYVEEKPDYTLESVEDIIESAKKRADEKIARMYNLKTSDIQRIGNEASEKPSSEPAAEEARPKIQMQETSIKKPLKIGETVTTGSKKYDTVSIPKVTNTLFDDFSARRTDLEGGAKITTPYSEASAPTEDDHTRTIPDLKPETEAAVTYEDIVSHSRPARPVDISSSSKKSFKPIKDIDNEPAEVKVNEFRGAKDIKRVGGDLKLEVVLAKYRLFATFILTALSAALHLPFFSELLSPVALGIVSAVILALAVIFNFNVMLSFKGAFTKRTKIELPLAFATLAMIVYFVYGIITAEYPFEPTLILLVPYLVYDYCAYRRASAIFGNFKIVASRRQKFAVSLIDDPATTSAMARSAIDGEVLAASSRESKELDCFLQNTYSDRSFAGKAGIFTACALIGAAVIASAIGVAFGSVSSALLAAATVLCLAAAPSLFIADMLPFASLSDKLHKERAGVCSKYSAEKLEQINAAVVSSSDLFPRGCVTLYNMTPLGANNLDETLTLAAAVAGEINSPLYPLFASILDDTVIIPEADSVKYEENLGISGWADDHHIMIGNRSLMEAHGVRVPALDIDRKILHKGFFPIYIACDQRACALLTAKYSVSRQIEAELGKLSDKNVLILVENCDPNITEAMLCDYYSLFPDGVKILDHNGTHRHLEATEPTDLTPAHGFHRGSLLGFLSVLSGSFRLRPLSILLYILHVLSAVVTCLLFSGISLGGNLSLMSVMICFLCQLAGMVVTLTAYFIGK